MGLALLRVDIGNNLTELYFTGRPGGYPDVLLNAIKKKEEEKKKRFEGNYSGFVVKQKFQNYLTFPLQTFYVINIYKLK